MNNNYENKILDAIQTLVDNAVSKAGYDKTIKAVISKCVNESTGKYVVKYQDSTFYAYSNDLDSVYSGGTPVYVLVPGNDMSQTKTILGSVDKLGTEYITISESDSAYQEIGSSIVTPAGEIPGISSYKQGGDSLIIYDADNPSSNTVNVDEEGAIIYFQNAQYLEIGGTFTTRLNEEQKRKGNYGLVFDIDYKYDNEDDPSNPTIRTQTYVLDINSMTGNPYSYNFGSEQNAIFEIDGEHFYRVKKITLECKNFPKYSNPYTNDIFISDIIFKALTPLTRDEIATNSLTFITKQGVYFSSTETGNPTRLIETEVKINRRVIPANSGLLRYYWFKEDSKVGLTDPNYSPFGGPGWRILNPANIIDETENIKDYITDVSSLTVDKNSNPAEKNEYKCVVIYNNEIQVERNFIIYNQGSNYTITIESDQGNYFKYNQGSPTLTCSVTPTGTYTYIWTETNSSNRTEILAETSNIYSVQLSKIANFSKFTCSVYSGGTFLGKSNIVITNSWDKEDNSYSLVMENADQVFKYNEKGIAPNNKSLEKPIAIKPLQFVLYDELGHQIEDNKISALDVTWYIPKDNTMIKKPSEELPEEDGYYVYTGQKTLNIDIASVYNNKKMNNIIRLKVKYNDRVLNTQSELAFIKEGEIGSNGTDFVCRIVPNVANGATVPVYPIFTANMNADPVVGDMNYIRPGGADDKWFKVQLYKDGVEIFTGVASGNSQEEKAVTVEWSILKNKYGKYNNVTVVDSSSFDVNSSTGAFSYINLTSGLDRAANIVKATVTYDGATYYATMPIILVQSMNNSSNTYTMDLVESTGFRYVMYTTDGLNPLYDSSNPFVLNIYNGGTDITDASDITFTYSTLGQIYNGITWVDEHNFITKTHGSNNPLAKNEADYRPIEKFSGLSVNNAVKCIVKKNNAEIARAYLPVHFYLNRYGNAALNGWDGNHVEINSNGGFILAPQIGAGKKEQDNSYTGVFMGSVREAGASNEEVGLFAYSSGERTVEINAENGVAKFGKTGKGQVVLNPTGDGHALIQSGDWDGTQHTGMEIDLTDPHIIWGNGNFGVDKNGRVTAKSLFVGSDGTTNLDTYIINNDTNINNLDSAVSVLQMYPATNSVYFDCNNDNKLLPGKTSNFNIQTYPKFKNEDITAAANNIVATFKQGNSWQASPYTTNNLTFTWTSSTQRLNIAISNTSNAIAQTSVDVKFTYGEHEQILTFTVVPNTKGAEGPQGPAGSSIEIDENNTWTKYIVSNDNTSPPGASASWVESPIPATSDDYPYLWTWTKVTYSDGTSTDTYGVSSTMDSLSDFISTTTNFIEATSDDLEEIHKQIDGAIDTWFYNYTPSPLSSNPTATPNIPASDWYPNPSADPPIPDTREQHLSDVFYDNSTGYAYRYTKITQSSQEYYVWTIITDSAVAEALAAAQNAQTTADSKIKTYYQTSSPSSGMEEGDLWVDTDDNNQMYYYNGTNWVSVRDATITTAQNKADSAYALAQTAKTLNVILTNENQSVPADADGGNPVLTSAVTTIQAYYGNQNVSSNITATATPSSGVTGTLSTTKPYTYTVSGFTVDSGYVDFNITYVDSSVTPSVTLTATARFNLSKAKAGQGGSPGQSAKLITITPTSQVFKKPGNSQVYTPSTITLTPEPQNCTVGKWYYYRTSDTTWVEITRTSTSTTEAYKSGNNLIVPSGMNYNNNATSVSFKVTDSTSAVADIITISKISDGDDATQYYTYVRYSENADGHDYVDTPTASTIYMGVSVTTATSAPAYDDISWEWSRYVGEDGSSVSITSKNIKYGYNDSGTDYSTVPATRDSSHPGGWDTSIPNTPDGYYLWTKTIVNYSTGDSTTSYSVAYQGVDGDDATQYYTYIRYSQYSDGHDYVTTPTSNTKYIGVSVTTATSAPAYNDSTWKWSKYAGDNGTSYYTYVRYSQYADGHSMVDTPTASTIYVGLYSGTSSTVPAYTEFEWSKYVGDKGENATNIVCGNEAQIISCDKDGKVLENTTITIPFAGYTGSSRKACTVTVSDLPTGITETTNTPATTSADGSLVLTAAANSTLDGGTSGTITLTFSCNLLTFVKKFAWSKAIRGATGADGAAAYSAYLTNEAQMLIPATVATVETTLCGYEGRNSKSLTISKVNGVTATTTETATGITGINFKVSSTSRTTNPKITFITTAALPENVSGVIPIMFTIYGDSGSRTLNFAYSTTKAGENATVYEIETSAHAIARDTNDTPTTFSPSSVTFTAYSKTGNNARVAYSGKWKIETSTNGTSWSTASTSTQNESSKTYTPSGDTIKLIKASLYVADTTDFTTTPLDIQTVTIVEDGINGTDGVDGYTVWTYPSDPSASSGTYTFTRSSMVGPTEVDPQVGEFIYGPRYRYTIATVTSTTVTATVRTDLKGAAGADAYTVLLSNESHTFAAGPSTAVGETITITPYVYKGATQRTDYTIGTITGQITGKLTATVSSSTPYTVSVTASNTLDTQSGSLTIPITVDSKTFNKQFSWALSKAGSDGDPATVYEVVPTVYSIIKNVDDTYTPSSVDFAAFSVTGTSASHPTYSGRWITQYSLDGSTWTTIATGSSDTSSVTVNMANLISANPAFIRALICPAGTVTPTVANALDSQSVFIVNDIEGLEIGGRNYIKYSDLEVSPIYGDEYSDTFTGDGVTNRFVINGYLANPNQDLAALSHLLLEEDIQDILINNTSIGNNSANFTSTSATSYTFGSGLGKTYLDGYLPKKITGLSVNGINNNYTLVGHSNQQVYSLGASPSNIYSVVIYAEDGTSQTVDSSDYSYSSGTLTFTGSFYPDENSQIIVTVYPYTYDGEKYTLTFVNEYKPASGATVIIKSAKYTYEPSIGILTLWKTPEENDTVEVQYGYEYYSNIIPVQEGENWYLSYYVKAEQSYNDEICALELFDSLEAAQPVNIIYYSGQVSTEYKRFINKYIVTSGVVGIRFRYLSLQNNVNKQNTYEKIQLEKGTVTTDWVPNSDDMTIERFYYAPLITDVEARRVTKEDANIDWITKETDFDVYQTYMLEYLFDDIHYLWEKDKYIYKSDNVIESSITDLKIRMESHEEYFLSNSSVEVPLKTDPNWTSEKIKIDISNTDKTTYEKDYFIWNRTATVWNTGVITYTVGELDNTTNALTKIAQQNGQAIINLSDKGYTRIFGDFIYLVDEAQMEQVRHGIVMGCGYDVGHSTAGGIAYFYYQLEDGETEDPNKPMGWDENSHQYTKNIAFSSVWSVDGTMDLTHLNTVSIKASDIQDGTLKLGEDPNTPGHLEIYSQEGLATISANGQGIRVRLNNGGEARITRAEGLVITSKTERDPVTGVISGEDIKVFGSNSGGDGFEATKVTVSQELDFKDYMKMIPIQQKDSNNNVLHKGIGFIKG